MSYVLIQKVPASSLVVAPAVGWPNASNTGYAVGPLWSGSLTSASSNDITSPGTYSNLRFTGPVNIGASNVRLTSCLIDCSADTTDDA